MIHDTHTCPQCGESKPLTEFAKDKYKKSGHKSACKECDRKRASQYYEKTRREKLGHKRFERLPQGCCPTCGEVFRPRSGTQVYCGRTCSGIARRGNPEAAKKRTRKAAIATQIDIRECTSCGCLFAPTHERNVNCSPECGYKARRVRTSIRGSKRRVWAQLTKIVPIDPHDIYQRDNWTCGICGNHIDQKLEWPHPNSVSLDHIRPLSWGGGHTAENTQASHLVCNQSKGAHGELDDEAKAFRSHAIGNARDIFGLHGEWIPSPEHEGMLINIDGRVFNTRSMREVVRRVVIHDESVRVDHLVAGHFIGPKPDDRFYLKHINGDDSDNHPDNLEWVLLPASGPQRAECARGHQLKGVNIVGNNQCRCCAKATSLNYSRGGSLSEEQLQALADDYYREMLETKQKEWLPIPGLDGYSASRQGQIRKDKTGRLVKGTLGRRGRVHMFLANGVKTRFDRSVMKAFGIPQPSALHYPIHLDGNAKNHSLSNLEWATRNDDPRCVAASAA